LNRAILEQGWSGFATMLAYKLDERGGTLTLVPASYSSQECFSCGTIDAQNRKSQAVFECVACGHQDHADRNAAKVLERRRSTALLDVEGRQSLPLEASTRKAAAERP
jgi:putative transposase